MRRLDWSDSIKLQSRIIDLARGDTAIAKTNTLKIMLRFLSDTSLFVVITST